MNAYRPSSWRELLRLPQGTAISIETAALLIGTAFFVVGFVVSIFVFWGRELEIAGPGSIGTYAAIAMAYAVTAPSR